MQPLKLDDYKGEFNLNVMHRMTLKKALTKHEGNREKAAKEMGVTVRTVYNMMIKHNV